MDFALFLLALIMFWEIPASSGLRCYVCEAQRMYSTSQDMLCEHFDGSARFIAECPDSTGCVKKETVLDRLGEMTKSIERSCARQTMDGDQEKINGKWQYVKTIHEVYGVGCFEDSAENGKLTRATNCFCREDLCNGANTLTRSILTSILLLSMLLIVR